MSTFAATTMSAFAGMAMRFRSHDEAMSESTKKQYPTPTTSKRLLYWQPLKETS
jgi:hypothetical protein